MGYSVQLRLSDLDLDREESVIADVLDCLDLLGGADPSEIEKRIPDPAYRRNFIALARRLAPDGDHVTTVGFTAAIGGTERRVSLTRPASAMIPPGLVDKDKATGTSVIVQGALKFANSLQADNEIKVVDAEGKIHRIIVPEGYMDDIVRPLWDCEVKVEGVRRGNKIHLQNVIAAAAPGGNP